MPLFFSQNGFSANNRSLIAVYTVPGTTIRLAVRSGDVATVLIYFASRWNKEVEPLRAGQCWGYAERLIRAGFSLSNHASGTAIDLNSLLHQLGASPTVNLSSKQIATIHKILRDCDGVLRWGGDYHERQDSMHTEVVGSQAQVSALAAKIRAATLKKSTSLSKRKQINAVKKAIGFRGLGAIDGISHGRRTDAAIKAAFINARMDPIKHRDLIIAVQKAVGLKPLAHPGWGRRTSGHLHDLGFKVYSDH